jgi:hypothetical protein
MHPSGRRPEISRPMSGTSLRKASTRSFLAQLETMLALGNGYLGMRGCPEEGGPNAENATLINGFYETRPIVYPEDAYGFAKTGQTIVGVKPGEHGINSAEQGADSAE